LDEQNVREDDPRILSFCK